ncbi:hypothetical protein [Bdellovibrio sp. HCB274]|uniref:hypothetical protein n=1 Tax=Bdellovibrio sp. HCB274 TaxID=3394361 RepID=UPI0039B5C51A
MKLLFGIFSGVVLFTSFAHSAASMYPMGHQEALLGNAGVALPASPGNSIFNPAGLAFYETKGLNLTVSGNALEQQRFEMSGLESEDATFNIRPLLANSIVPVGRGYGSFYLAYPMSLNIQQVQSAQYSGYGLQMRYSLDYDVIQMGLAYAGLLRKDFGWGLAVSASYASMVANSYYSVTNISGAVTNYQNSKTKYLQPSLRPGVLWEVNSWYNVGLTAELRLPLLMDENFVFKSATDSSTPSTVNTEKIIYKSETAASYSLTLGQKIQVSSNDVLLDVNFNDSYDYKGEGGKTESSPEVWIYSIGWTPSGKTKWKPALGFAFGNTGTSENQVYTAGVIVNERSNELVLGAYYQKNNPKVANTTPNSTIGLMFSSNVIY